VDDETRDWPRLLLIGLGSLVAVSLLVGGVMSVVALGAADVVGIGNSDEPSSEPSLYIPPSSPSSTPSDSPGPAVASPDEQASGTSGPDRRKKHRGRRLTLHARPSTVDPFERINLTGRYRGGNGASLQVQRFEHGWSDFPTVTTVHGRRFATYVMSGHTGRNRFRVVDEATGRHSNAVSVTIR